MSSDRAKRIATIVDEALAVPEGERASYIASACDGDEQLAAEVADLISYRSKADDPEFVLAETRLPSPGVPVSQMATADLNDDPAASRRAIGPYRVVRVLGEGGMGIVYEAEQSVPVRRSVALKIIKPGMDSRAIIARFEAERQALAMMDHPGVAKVFDGGTTDDGRPYFAMELVRGDPITDHCAKNAPSPEETLGLFLAVCDAVQHAHAKGVIHRDLKPSNILVSYTDGKAAPKVIDFGIAKALHQRLTENTLVTAIGQFIGTPEYMSPEQADPTAQDIDTRTDIYALGVVLYEILTGQRPFDTETFRSGSFVEIQRVIREVDPPKPSTRLERRLGETSSESQSNNFCPFAPRQLKQDLDWITIKCLAKSRERRYQTAAALADDIRRHLNNEPVLAGPPSTTYRLGKLMRRNRAMFTAGTVVLATLIVGLAGTSYGLIAADRRATEASEAREELELVAEFQASQIRAIEVPGMGDRLRASLEEAARAADDRDPDLFLQTLATINFTDIALRSLESDVLEPSQRAIMEEFEDRPRVQARLLQSLAQTRRELGLYESAIEPQERALTLRRAEFGPGHPLTLESVMQQGQLFRAMGELTRAEEQLRRAADGLLETVGPANRETLNAMNSHALVLSSLGRLDEAEPIYRSVIEHCEDSFGPDDEGTLSTQNNLASLLHSQGKLDEAEQLYKLVLEKRTRLLGHDHALTLLVLNNLAFLYFELEQFDDAESMFLRALDGARQNSGSAHSETVACLANLGGLTWRTGAYERADQYWSEALSITSTELGADHPLTLDAHHNLGLLRISQERQEEAVPLFEAALDGRRSVFGPDSSPALSSLSKLVHALIELSQFSRAESLALENERLRRETFGTESRYWTTAATQLTKLYKRWNESAPSPELELKVARWSETAGSSP
ncbi:MAG: serine/threonine-protein kinase [Phycisphaerales bacterium]